MIQSKYTFNQQIVNVKWGKEALIVECNTSEEPIIFKSQIYALTNVPVQGQKIMIKGKVLKDDDCWSKIGVKDGMTVMMMGTAEGKQLKEPDRPVKFLEDMTPAEKARALNQSEMVVVPPGLENLGNTCYMNSTL